MRLGWWRLVVAIGVVAPWWGEARAADDVRARIDALGERMVGKIAVVGVVIGALRDGEVSFHAYGRADRAERVPLDEHTVFEIGSITKVFTTLLLMRAVEAGQVRLGDPAAKYLPAGVTMPGSPGRPITLAHLATHRSGLPRLPDNFLPKTPLGTLARIGDPYAAYDADDLYAWLKTASTKAPPGERFEYSNAAMGLLGHLLARRAGVSYEALLRREVLEPLGMRDTGLEVGAKHPARLAQGHNELGLVTSNWRFRVLAPAGALESTAADMMRFLKANVGLGPAPIVRALRACHRGRIERRPGAAVGLGWMRGPARIGGRPVVWHNGGTGGFHAFLGFIEGTRTGVVVLANGAADIDGAALELLEALAR